MNDARGLFAGCFSILLFFIFFIATVTLIKVVIALLEASDMTFVLYPSMRNAKDA
jgi:hypothetical protein